MLVPTVWLSTWVGGQFLKRGQNQRFSILSNIFGVLSGVSALILYINYSGPKDDMFLFIGFLITGTVFCFSGCSFLFDSGFLNDIADPKIGGMFITFVGSFMNLSGMLPETLSLYFIKYFNYTYYLVGTLALSMLCLPLTYWIAAKIDRVDVLEYRIYKPESNNKTSELTILEDEKSNIKPKSSENLGFQDN